MFYLKIYKISYGKGAQPHRSLHTLLTPLVPSSHSTPVLFLAISYSAGK